MLLIDEVSVPLTQIKRKGPCTDIRHVDNVSRRQVEFCTPHVVMEACIGPVAVGSVVQPRETGRVRVNWVSSVVGVERFKIQMFTPLTCSACPVPSSIHSGEPLLGRFLYLSRRSYSQWVYRTHRKRLPTYRSPRTHTFPFRSRTFRSRCKFRFLLFLSWCSEQSQPTHLSLPRSLSNSAGLE